MASMVRIQVFSIMRLLVNEKGDVQWLNASLKITETREELSTTCNPKVMSRCLSAPDGTVEDGVAYI